MFQTTTPIILASSSGARRGLLAAAGLSFAARPAAIDEAEIKRAARAEGAGADPTTVLLAAMKAERTARHEPQALVIGADQMLVCEGEWFDKPTDINEARRHLQALRGRTHELVTAVVCYRDESRVWQHVARPRLTMRAFSDRFLDAYLAAEGEAALASVGGYRLEGPGVHLFERIEGEHAAILGLPMLALLGFLRQHGAVLA